MRDEYLFTDEMKRDFICHPTAAAPRFYNEGETLSDVYGKHSDEKEAAFRYCKWIFNKYRKYQAFDFAIRSHNAFTFAANFKFVNPLNGCIMIAVITKCKNQLYFA